MHDSFKILTVVYDLGIGGTQRAAQNFAVAYKQFGHDSRVFTVYEGGIRALELEAENVVVYLGGETSSESLQKIKNWNPNIIHIHRSGEADKKLSDILRTLKNDQTKIVETNVFSMADNSDDHSLTDVHMHLSRWCYWKWKNFLRVKSIGIVMPYLVLPQNFYREKPDQITLAKKWLGLPEGKFIFGRVGQQSPAKFHPELFRSFDKLYLERQDVHLLIVGLPDIYQKELRQLNSFKAGAITLVNSIVGDGNLRLAYNSMDCFLHYSSIGESFGMVLAEAQLCEVPVISISTPKADNSQLEVLVHDKSATILKNHKELKYIMNKFASGDVPLSQYGSYGREHILQNYTPVKLIPKLNSLFKSLLSNKQEMVFKQPSISEIKELQKIGVSEYSLSIKAFLLRPRLYLTLADMYGRTKKLIKRI